jgi:tetratricopeptide (TPR) repeat protein
MTSFRDILNARADDDPEARDGQASDDLQAMKDAFRTAVTPRNAGLHREDLSLASRIRRSAPAGAIRRDAKHRPVYNQQLELVYDQQLEHERLRLLDDQRLQHQRPQVWRMGAMAAVCAVILVGAYERLKLAPTAAIVEDKPAQTVQTAMIPAAMTASVETTAEVRATVYAETPGAGFANDAPRPVSAPVAPDRSTDSVFADRFQPAPRAVPADRPHDAAFYKESGIASYRTGDFPRAIVNLDMAIRLDPGDAQTYDIRGNALDEMGAFNTALADYNDAIRIDPRNPVFFLDRAVLWHGKGKLDETLIDFDRAIRFSFSDPNLYCDRGLVWYEKGSHARAIADFDRAVNLDPVVAAACISRGRLLHRNGGIGVEFANLGKPIHVSAKVFDASRKPKQ